MDSLDGVRPPAGGIGPLDLVQQLHPESVSWSDFLTALDVQATDRVCISMAGSSGLRTPVSDEDTPGMRRGVRNEQHDRLGYHWSSVDFIDARGMPMTANCGGLDPLSLHERVWALYEIVGLHDRPGEAESSFVTEAALTNTSCRLVRHLFSFTSHNHRILPPAPGHPTRFCCPRHRTPHEDGLESIKLTNNTPYLAPLKAKNGNGRTWRFWVFRGVASHSVYPVLWSYVWSPSVRERNVRRNNRSSAGSGRSRHADTSTSSDSSPNSKTTGTSSDSSTADSPTKGSSANLVSHELNADDNAKKRRRDIASGTASEEIGSDPGVNSGLYSTYTMPSDRLWNSDYLRPVVRKLAALYSLPGNTPVRHTIESTGVRGPHMEVGNGALGSIQGYQTAARLQDWHSGDRIQSLFQRLLDRVQFQRDELIKSSQYGEFVPYLGDITANTIEFQDIDGHPEIFRLNSTPLSYESPRRDVVHILARLAFLTHFLSRVPDTSPRRAESLATARHRLESDILDTYFGSRDTPSSNATSVARIRFWRFLDIEYCDYVAYWASQPKHTVLKANQDFAQSVKFIHVLADNETSFAQLGIELPEAFSIQEFTTIRADVDDWLSTGFRNLLIDN